MKNFLFLALWMTLFCSSCKKDRVCKCTVTSSGTTYTHAQSGFPGVTTDTTFVTPLYTVNTNELTFKKVSKKKAKHNCFDKSDKFSEQTQNSIPGFFSLTVTNTGTREYDCTLE